MLLRQVTAHGRYLGLAGCVFLALGCSKKVATAECLSWEQHFGELAAVADQRLNECKVGANARAVWKSSLDYRWSSVKSVCEHLPEKHAPKPVEAQCYLQARTSAAVRACDVSEGSALDEFVWAAASVGPTADSLCEAN